MEPTDSGWSRGYAIGRAHILAEAYGKTFVVAFNKDKSGSLLCCSLEKFQIEHPFGLTEEDVFHRAEPGTPIPGDIA